MVTLANPLNVLMWVFAVSACAISVLAVSTLGLAVRHQRRRRNGVYSRFLTENESSEVLQVLTVSDYQMDPSLRAQVHQQRIRKVRALARGVSEDHVSEGRVNPSTG